MKKKSKQIILLLLIILFILFGLDPRIQVTNYEYSSVKIPNEFNGYKICLISDLHCKNFGENNAILIQQIEEMNPDIIVLTGDIVDENHDSISSVENLLQGIHKNNIPTYFITGNHELDPDARDQYNELLSLFPKYGITDLDDSTVDLSRNNQTIKLSGAKWYSKYITQYLPMNSSENFHILLYHGADFFDAIQSYQYDLVLSGHIHGGIIRLPFVNAGLFGNSSNFFPEYVSGIYQNESQTCTMIVSRGLGDTYIPRFYNRPELTCITLKSSE